MRYLYLMTNTTTIERLVRFINSHGDNEVEKIDGDTLWIRSYYTRRDGDAPAYGYEQTDAVPATVQAVRLHLGY